MLLVHNRVVGAENTNAHKPTCPYMILPGPLNVHFSTQPLQTQPANNIAAQTLDILCRYMQIMREPTWAIALTEMSG